MGEAFVLTITCPDLCHSVHVLSHFLQTPRQEHLEAVVRVLKYLKGAPGQGIILRVDSELQLYSHCDSDWATCPITRRSVTGYFIQLGQSPISWRTKKQPTVALSLSCLLICGIYFTAYK